MPGGPGGLTLLRTIARAGSPSHRARRRREAPASGQARRARRAGGRELVEADQHSADETAREAGRSPVALRDVSATVCPCVPRGALRLHSSSRNRGLDHQRQMSHIECDKRRRSGQAPETSRCPGCPIFPDSSLYASISTLRSRNQLFGRLCVVGHGGIDRLIRLPER